MSSPQLDRDGVRERLRLACEQAGSQKTFAENTGLSPQYISQVLAGRCEPGAAILDALGLDRHVAYVEREADR